MMDYTSLFLGTSVFYWYNDMFEHTVDLLLLISHCIFNKYITINKNMLIASLIK